MVDLILIASLEGMLNEHETQQYFQKQRLVKSHSSACVRRQDAIPEPALASPNDRCNEEELHKQRKTHSSQHKTRSILFARDTKYDRNVFTQFPGSVGDSEPPRKVTNDHQEQQFSSFKKPRGGRLVQFSKDARTRMRGLTRGANDKRRFDEAGLNDFKILQTPNRQHNTISTLFESEEEGTSDDELEPAYRSARSQPRGAHHAPVEVGHEGSTMSARRRGRQPERKHRTLSTDSTAPEGLAGELESSLRVKEDALEIGDTEEEEYEKEGVVEQSTRIKQNINNTVKGHRSENVDVQSAKDEEEYAHDDARVSKDSYEHKDAPKKRQTWAPFERYLSDANSLPDFKNPIQSKPIASKQPGTSSMQGRGIGGFKPLNTLHNDPHNKPNPVSKSQPLWFESHRNHERRSDTHPPKRQRTEEGSTSRYHTHKKVIDLETPSSQTKGTPSARSTHSQSVQWSNRLPEYKAAEMNVKQLKVRRKLSGSVIRQTSKSAGHPQRPKLESSNRAVIDHGRLTNGGHREDPDDPISDSEPPVLKPSPKTHIEVVIPPLPSPNRGDAKLHPARDSESRDRGSTTTARKKTATTSHYFPAEGIDRKELDSLLSDSVVEVAESDLVATARPNGVSTKKQGVSHSSKGRGAPGASEDELAMDSNPPPKANGLILKRKQVTGLPSKAKKREHPPDSGSDASEDHLRNSSISDTKLRKKKKQYKVLGDSRFDVLQFFTQRQSWLHAHEQPWSLQQDHTTGILTFFDHGGYLVEDMQLESKRFHQISHNAENGKLHINKSADHEARGAHQIFLELAGAEQSREFCNNASLLSRSITILNKTNLDKIFAKTQAGLLTHKINDNDEPEDIKLAKRNHEAKVGSAFDVAQQVKQEASRTSSQIGQDAESPARRNRSFLRALSPCPSDDAFGLEPIELSRPTKLASMDDGNLHLTRSKNRSRELAPRQLAKIRSPSPERWTEINSAWARDYNWQSSVIFPKDGRKKATVDKQDIERLDEGQFLNDNLIMFWLLKLEQDLTDRDPELATRVYFHNTFFYERLTQPFKGKKGINYEAVERWTSKVDLFSYDYIIVPVNEHSHWYLAVIYNAPKLLKPKPNVDSSQSQDAESVQLSTDIAEKSSPLPLELSPSKMINIMPQEDQPKSSKEGSEPKRTSSTERVQNHPDVSDDLPESDHQPIHDRVTQEAAAIAKPPKPATPVKRGRKKSFTPAPRKFSPKEPKIITLDSLGMSHSATCTNLRDYLVAEGKAKRNVDIDPPRALGMTALNIPQQKNYCDCGLYLLSYVEALLENPDGFTENLLAKLDMEIEHRFEKASQMRIRIRELLLELQKLQVAKKAGKDHKTGKGGSNKVFPKAEEACPIPSESRMREESNSARSSADPDCPKSRKSFEPPDSAENGTAPSVLRSSSHTATPPRHTRLRPESPPKSSFFAQSDQTGDAVEHLDESRRPEYHEKGGEQQKNSGPLLATTSLLQEVMTTVEEEPCDSFHNHNLNKQPRSTGASLPSAMNPVSSHDTGSKNLNLLQPGTSLANALEVEDDSPQKDPCIIRRVLSPDNSVTPPQRDLVSPSPDVVPTVVSVRGRASTPYPQDMASVSSGFDETQVEDGNVLLSSLIDSSNLESPPLEPAARGPLPIPASNFVDMTGDDSQVADDEVMLLDIGSAPVPAFLGDSSSPAPSSPSTEKQIVTSRNTSNHKQDKPTKRSKNIVIGGQGRPKFMERDSSDKAVIGRVKFAGGQKRFSE